MLNVNGNTRRCLVAFLMADAFWGGLRHGYTVEMINGRPDDCRLENLRMVPWRGQFPKPGVSWPVEKVDAEGNVLEVYRTMKEAGEANYMTAASVSWYCRGLNKKTSGGVSFRYSDGWKLCCPGAQAGAD